MRQRVLAARVGHLATTRPDGRPHVVPCCYTVEESTAYTAVDAKPKSSHRLQRIRNVERNAAASLVIDHYEEDWANLWWVRLDGEARILVQGPEREAATDLLAAKYAQYADQRPDGPVIALEIRTWRAWP